MLPGRRTAALLWATATPETLQSATAAAAARARTSGRVPGSIDLVAAVVLVIASLLGGSSRPTPGRKRLGQSVCLRSGRRHLAPRRQSVLAPSASHLPRSARSSSVILVRLPIGIACVVIVCC